MEGGVNCFFNQRKEEGVSEKKETKKKTQKDRKLERRPKFISNNCERDLVVSEGIRRSRPTMVRKKQVAVFLFVTIIFDVLKSSSKINTALASGFTFFLNKSYKYSFSAIILCILHIFLWCLCVAW